MGEFLFYFFKCFFSHRVFPPDVFSARFGLSKQGEGARGQALPRASFHLIETQGDGTAWSEGLRVSKSSKGFGI